MQTRFLTISLLQGVALAAFFGAVVQADRALPKSGVGDVALFQTWNGRASLAFFVLLVIWLIGLASALLHYRSLGASVKQLFIGRLRGLPAVSILLGPVGLVAGYALLFLAL